MVRVIPITKYPFLNTQNQLMEYDSNSKSFNVKDMFNYSFPHLDETEDERFETSPNINVVDLGAKMWEVNLSYESFNYDDIHFGDMRDIKFLIFKDMERNKKYYYFVEDIKQINSKIFRYTLSLDVIKTYWNEIKKFERVKPLRYFPKMKEGYFDYTEEPHNFRKQLNITKKDNIILKSKNISSKIMLHHTIRNKKNGITSYSFGGMWTYFYMRFSSEDTQPIEIGDVYRLNEFSFRQQNYYIIAYPKTNELASENPGVNRTVYNSLMFCPYLIKAVDSDIPPFNNAYSTFNSNINEVEIKYSHDKKTTMKINVSSWDDGSGEEGKMNFYAYTDYLKLVHSTRLPKSLRKYFEETMQLPDFSYFLIQVDNNPNNTALDNLLIPFNDIYEGKSWLSLMSEKYNIDFPIDYFERIRMFGEDNPSLTNALYQDLEIGYNNSNKMPIKIFDSNIDEYSLSLSIDYTSFIKHDLFNTEEIIRSVNNGKSFEEYTKRANELRNTIVKDDFQNYLLLNNNSLMQKEKQLYKYNDVKDIISGGLSVASAIATSNPLAIVGSSYNLTKNLFENEEKRKLYEAEMEDRKLAPIQYEVGNFNVNDNIFSYFPVLVRYGFSSGINTDFTRFNSYGMDDERNINSIKEYGYLTLGEIKDMRYLFTRRYYNFIQIVEGDSMISLSAQNNIPNSHLEMIIEILESGVRFFTRTSIEGLYSEINPEIE